ncbi:hypothetical protein Hanom_Chr16g01425291 [Helianthus anomalus]
MIMILNECSATGITFLKVIIYLITILPNNQTSKGRLDTQWRSLRFPTEGSKTYIPKKFYRNGGSKTYIPQNFYTKATYITLLSEKFGGSGAPPGPF